MKLLSGIMGLTLTGAVTLASANAADIYAPGPGSLKDPYVAPWTGFYLGVHGGVAQGSFQITDFNEHPSKFKDDAPGAFGGGQLGYNFQRGSIVFGVESDLGWMDLVKSRIEPASLPAGDIKGSINAGFYGDVTGRIGFLSDAKTLVYAKGGLAFYDGDLKVTDAGATPAISTKSSTLVGWTIGAGTEYKFTPKWTFKAEYQYFDFGSQTSTMPSNDPDRYKTELTAHSIKVGFNYFVSPSFEPLK
jgi:outer membrane immunogenic protein